MRVSVPENFQNSAVGRFLFLENFFLTVDFSGGEGVSMGFERLERQDVMAMCGSLTARANYWQKFSSACPNKCERLRTHRPRSVLIQTLPSRWVMGSDDRLAHFYYT